MREKLGGPTPYPSGTLPGMDIVIRRARPEEYEAVGEITAQAYLGDGLLDFGESDEYLGELRDVAKRARPPTYWWPCWGQGRASGSSAA